MGASILRRLNLDELIARDAKEYVQIAVNLAYQRGYLADLRRSLRPRMTASPLCDLPAFARHIEAAYRRMWEIWCAGKPPMAFAVEPEPRLAPALQQKFKLAVHLTATPIGSHSFVNWTQNAKVVSPSASYTFTMPSANVTLTAHFK